MKIFIHTSDRWGTGYYRGILLKREFDKLGVKSVFSYCLPIYDVAQAFDVLYVIRPHVEDIWEITRWHELKRLGVPIVVDGDDAFWDIPENHPASRSLSRLDVKRSYEGIYQAADLLTTTTELTGKYFLGHIRPGTPVHVIPNAFDPDYKMFRPFHGWNPVKEDGGRLIGWMGGTQHAWDLEKMLDVFRFLSERGDHMMFLGDVPPGIIGVPRTHSAPGSDMAEYYLQTPALLGFDVGLGPLQDIPFNHIKSPLKIVEYLWLAGCPCVVSDLPCFDEIESSSWVRKVKGFDTNDWMQAIDGAMATILEEGRRYTLSPKYNLKNTVRLWYDAFLSCYRRVRGEDPPGQYPSFHETKKTIVISALQVAGQAAAEMMGRA